MLDLALDDDLVTRFRVVMDNDGDEEIGALLADKRTLLGLSDAGAHASQLCDACYSTHLLGHWVRERKALSLEDAVWRLTGQPHQAFRISNRGLIKEGFFADMVAFDPDTVGTTPTARVYDQPGGADRLLVRSTGVEYMWVNGVATRVGGEEVPGVASGRLIRS
jgi:N-acyl-D-aspartate/D-glutamate deacylase